MRLYTKDHTWVVVTGGRARVGISDFAQKELGEIAYVELPGLGKHLSRGDTACTMDSMKTSSEIYAPIEGTVRAVNPALATEDGCGLINSDPLGEGWLFELDVGEAKDLDSLLEEEEYLAFVNGG